MRFALKYAETIILGKYQLGVSSPSSRATNKSSVQQSPSNMRFLVRFLVLKETGELLTAYILPKSVQQIALPLYVITLL